MGSAGPSRLQVVLPLDLSSAVALAGGGSDGKEDETLCDKWRDGRRDGLLSLASKAPEWSEELKTYTLEYNNRATLASVKNIQLVQHGQSGPFGSAPARRLHLLGARLVAPRSSALPGQAPGH